MELVRGSCARCGAGWVGVDRCHCVRCCQTWDDVELFDAHRCATGCADGAGMGLAQTRNGIWQRSRSPQDSARDTGRRISQASRSA
ncbi:MAG TPA: hypothetical protein VGM60_09370 [Pseudonocardia sp.]|uniref:FDXHR family putative zinc-binding protein n=1 Tax=Pseudonocardia sp. TaxID=60912 RepID=UPI002F42E8D1